MTPTEQPEKPKILKATLADESQVTVQRITWEGWRTVKDRMLKTLSASEVHRALSSLLTMFQTMKGSGRSESDAKVEDLLAQSDLVELAPPALALLNRTLDDMTADLMEHCIEGPMPERLEAEDVIELRNKIFRVNDFRGLLESEKNSLSALMSDFLGAVNLANMKSESNSTGS